MKKFILSIICMGCLFCGHAQDNENGTSMIPIFSSSIEYIKHVESNGYEIVRLEYDIIHKSKSTTRILSSGYEYGILAFGDYRMKDVDIKVYKKEGDRWVFITKDSDADSMAGVSVTPTETGEYRIDVEVYQYNDGYNVGHYGLLIFHE